MNTNFILKTRKTTEDTEFFHREHGGFSRLPPGFVLIKIISEN